MDVGRKRVSEAKAIAEGASAAYREHIRLCSRCTAASRDNTPMRLCDVGYPLAKADAYGRWRLAVARGEVIPRGRGEQLELF